ncbi:hypothetical protein [Winogradskyella sp. SYSU M77433]|uniref:YciI family protein n=1 Tax=Winogradskyella sp. SYSU M77433 TaxID=3042722 RepID=UPI002480E8CD|nr:hypothetical protein [Winogradskyella sp. SYSU M77433]MDH7913867.1 hypothetical protein [Winogradskyella sp. SYSU M77433]
MEKLKHIVVFVIVVLSFSSCKDEPQTKEEVILPKVETETIEEQPEVQKVEEKKESVSVLKKRLKSEGYEIFDYVDEKTQDTILMQQYFIAFLKRGPIRTQNEEEAALLQEEHLAHLGNMYELGYADISGPFGDDGDIRGITIYNVPTLKMADSLASSDPMVQAGRLVIEVHPWWAAKGFPLR